MRTDAERNRRRVLAAARDLFAARGLGVSFGEIAEHARVGVGTVYRRFPDREALLDELYEELVDEWAKLFEEGAGTTADPWRTLVEVHERALELWAANRGLMETLLGSPQASARSARQRARLYPLAERLLVRARNAGQVRPDATTADLGVAMLMVAAVIEAGEAVDPELWRRYLSLALAGLRAHGAPVEPMAGNIPGPEELNGLLDGRWKRRRAS